MKQKESLAGSLISAVCFNLAEMQGKRQKGARTGMPARALQLDYRGISKAGTRRCLLILREISTAARALSSGGFPSQRI